MHISAPNNCPHRMFDTPHVHTVERERDSPGDEVLTRLEGVEYLHSLSVLGAAAQ